MRSMAGPAHRRAPVPRVTPAWTLGRERPDCDRTAHVRCERSIRLCSMRSITPTPLHRLSKTHTCSRARAKHEARARTCTLVRTTGSPRSRCEQPQWVGRTSGHVRHAPHSSAQEVALLQPQAVSSRMAPTSGTGAVSHATRDPGVPHAQGGRDQVGAPFPSTWNERPTLKVWRSRKAAPSCKPCRIMPSSERLGIVTIRP